MNRILCECGGLPVLHYVEVSHELATLGTGFARLGCPECGAAQDFLCEPSLQPLRSRHEEVALPHKAGSLDGEVG